MTQWGKDQWKAKGQRQTAKVQRRSEREGGWTVRADILFKTARGGSTAS